jgi:hypothetical protein
VTVPGAKNVAEFFFEAASRSPERSENIGGPVNNEKNQPTVEAQNANEQYPSRCLHCLYTTLAISPELEWYVLGVLHSF